MKEIFMKANEVLRLLRISRPTLTNWIRLGKIKCTKLPSGHYDYDDDFVYQLMNKNVKRKTVIYARVSSNNQKKNLETQIETLKQFAFMNGYQLNAIYSDIASGISFEKRKDFFEMLDEILEHKIEKVIIAYKDRLSRVGFGLFQTLFRKFGCEIIVMSEVGSPKLDSEEIFEEIISMLHCYSMKLYSKRNKDKKILEIGEE